ncbi:PREDICTED: uncharacterized protein LOC103084567 [Lipotes vexillifer]|uniref:Uncharacterized protein LOC103084567 n=1 Tax=Lipotes vexillifer TaxID=118797 RepID=A0A340Y8Z7_LIPVE|nr:PREDICTED: uncharacterized protein LOC103084567 [Lipotes vexillifer]
MSFITYLRLTIPPVPAAHKAFRGVHVYGPPCVGVLDHDKCLSDELGKNADSVIFEDLTLLASPATPRPPYCAWSRTEVLQVHSGVSRLPSALCQALFTLTPLLLAQKYANAHSYTSESALLTPSVNPLSDYQLHPSLPSPQKLLSFCCLMMGNIRVAVPLCSNAWLTDEEIREGGGSVVPHHSALYPSGRCQWRLFTSPDLSSPHPSNPGSISATCPGLEVVALCRRCLIGSSGTVPLSPEPGAPGLFPGWAPVVVGL